MLPWPTYQPVHIAEPTRWQPTPVQQIACLQAGVSLQLCHEPGLTYWVAWVSGDGCPVDNWEAVVAFAKSKGVRL